ncbi:hypothetical protein GCM10009795_047870 [Nocardioides hankookensis]|uniref:DUF4232 domain-containing protein n=1 Tax=Nocardioides hankookensis TaxID=443157 RepID=A0ABW1LGW6_9ACTN
MTKLLMILLLSTGPLTVVGGPAQAAAPECTNAKLVASYRSTDGGMSHEYGRIVLRNVSDAACSIRGYGGLSYVGGGDGTQVGAAATRTAGPVRRIVVRPGQRVVSEVAATDVAPYPRRRCRPEHVDGFWVYLPDETRAQFVAHPTTGCRNHRVHLLAHRAYVRP